MAKLMFHESKKITVIHAFIKQSDDDTADKAYIERRKYDLTLTVDYKTPTNVFISGLIKAFSDQLSQDNVDCFFRFLSDLGIERVEYERNGKLIEEVI